LRRSEADGSQAVRQSAPLEIDRSERERVRHRYRGVGKPLALPSLGSWVIDFKDPQVDLQGLVNLLEAARGRGAAAPD
jgi:hypothetical protein